MRRRPKIGPVPHPVTVESSLPSPEEEQASGHPTPRSTVRPTQPERRTVTIGKSVHINGELSGNEDITVDGSVDGKIALKGHNLAIGPNGRIRAEVSAKSVLVVGRVVGNITAEDRVEVTDAGTVHGDIRAPRVVLADGARFTGAIDMQPQPSAIQAPAPEEPSQDREVGDAAFEKKPNDEGMMNPISDRRDDKPPEEPGRGSFHKPSLEDMPVRKASLRESSPGKPALERPSGEKPAGGNKPDPAKA